MKRFLLFAVLVAFAMTSALPATAQSKRIAEATLAPESGDRVVNVPSPVEARLIDEGVQYGQHNRPGADRDVFGSFNPSNPFEANDFELYPASAFAGTIAGDGLLYYIDQTSRDGAEGVVPDTLYSYDFDTQTLTQVGTLQYFDEDNDPVDPDSVLLLPQWADGDLDSETGNLILLGRFQACTAEAGGQLWSLDLGTREARPLITFVDPDNCPLSGAYDNENNRYIGMVPDAGAEGFYQGDLTTGETVAMIPLPDDMRADAVAPFIQSGATDFKLNDDPSDNESWIFLFEGVTTPALDLVSTARQATFDGDGLLNGITNFGEIDDSADYVEVLMGGFANIAPAPGGVSNEETATAGSFEFVGVYPNPFRSTATVMLRTSEAADVTVKAYDLLGRQVAVLHDGPLAATTHHFGLEAADLPAGVYFVSVRSGSFSQTKKVVLVD